MTRTLKHEFVQTIPAKLADGVIYISITYATAVHKCACGCGNEVVTPISPTDWQLTFDGETISLHPSVGNWNLPCQSHYWIRHNRVQWARRWSREEIAAGQEQERRTKDAYYMPTAKDEHAAAPRGGKAGGGLWRRAKDAILLRKKR